jgi:hypothetical protein
LPLLCGHCADHKRADGQVLPPTGDPFGLGIGGP